MKRKEPAGEGGQMETVHVNLSMSDRVIVESRIHPMKRWKANLLIWVMEHIGR